MKIPKILFGMFLLGVVTAAVGAEQAHVIPIHGEIDRSLVIFLRRSIELAKADEVHTIVFDLDTFGGRVDSALQITTLIGSLSDIRTVAYVTLSPEGTGVSWSAGALIAMSCNEIYMAPGTSIGAAAPVTVAPGGAAEPTDEKTVSAVRTQMAALAEKNGHSRGVALAMVDADIELVEAYVDGRLTAVTVTELEALKIESERGNEQQQAAASDSDSDGQTIDEIERGAVISPSGKLLSLTSGQMERYGISRGSPATFEELFARLNVAESDWVRAQRDTADRAVGFFTSGGVTGLLILIGLVALFIEITSPGFGIPGVVALSCFAFIFGGNALLGRVGSVELLLFLLGVVLLIVEIFLIPGFGVVGIGGLVLIASSLFLSRIDFGWPQFEWQWDIVNRNVLLVLGSSIGALVLFIVAAPLARRPFLFRRIAQTATLAPEEGYTVQGAEEVGHYLHKRGRVVSTLRPVGRAEIEGEMVTVESEGAFITAGELIEVSRVDGNRIVVRQVRTKKE